MLLLQDVRKSRPALFDSKTTLATVTGEGQLEVGIEIYRAWTFQLIRPATLII